MKQEYKIFTCVFIAGFVIHMILMSLIGGMFDTQIWADQIQYFLTHDSRVFDFYKAYGHPGTTIVELGSILHLLFNVSYNTAVALTVGILFAGASAACSVLCFMLYPDSPWWLATALVMILNRMMIRATPTSAVAMPLMVLVVLITWWLWRRTNTSKWHYVLWGVVAGIATATRFDVALLVSAPMMALLWYSQRGKIMLPVIAGWAMAFLLRILFFGSCRSST